MDEIGLSLLSHGPGTSDVFRPWLEQFNQENHVHVEAVVYEWEEAWPELVKAALYSHGPDVSEIGSTWIASLIAMNALSPFNPVELSAFGGENNFLPSVWQPALKTGYGCIWALPWLAYTRLIYYRRDLLEKAGIDEKDAFSSPEKVNQTLEKLSGSGVSMPWCVPTRHSRDTLHNVASWVWNNGGDFLSPDGRHVLFNDPKARAGIRAYFDLNRHLSAPARNLEYPDGLFKSGQAAVIMSGPWLWPVNPEKAGMDPLVAQNMGVAIPLGKAFIGFSFLVKWKYSRRENMVLKLIHMLSGSPFLNAYAPFTGPLSVRKDFLDQSSLREEANYQVMVQAIKTGGTFPQGALWGKIEEKLAAALDNIWQEILAVSEPKSDEILSRHLDPLADRLEVTLSTYNSY